MLCKNSHRNYLVLVIVLLTNLANAQQSLLERKVNISFDNLPIEKALQQIENSSGARFSYNSDIISTETRVSIIAKGKPLGKVLVSVLGSDYYFKSTEKYIIILQKIKKSDPPPKEKIFSLSGRVVDSQTKQAIPEATIYDMVSLMSELSDSNGFFNVMLPPSTRFIGLRCCKLGYNDTVAFLRPSGKETANFRLTRIDKNISKIITVSSREIPLVDSTNLFLVKRIVSSNLLINSNNVIIPDKRIVQFSLLPGMGSNQLLGGSVVNHFSMNLLGGFSKGVSGFEAGGLLNINKDNVNGFQFCGLVNLTGKNVNGFQVCGVLNRTSGNVNGAQASCLVNFARDTVNGVQIAGLVNYARHPGFQLGLVNIADSPDGAPLGVFNIIRHGYYAISLNYDDIQSGDILFHMGTHRLYSMIGLCMRSDPDFQSWGICYGLGHQVFYPHRLSMNVELLSSVINAFGQFDSTTISRVGFSCQLSYRIWNNTFITAGPSLNTFIAKADNQQVDAYISDAIKGDSWHYAPAHTRFDAWIGGTFGIKIKI